MLKKLLVLLLPLSLFGTGDNLMRGCLGTFSIEDQTCAINLFWRCRICDNSIPANGKCINCWHAYGQLGVKRIIESLDAQGVVGLKDQSGQ